MLTDVYMRVWVPIMYLEGEPGEGSRGVKEREKATEDLWNEIWKGALKVKGTGVTWGGRIGRGCSRERTVLKTLQCNLMLWVLILALVSQEVKTRLGARHAALSLPHPFFLLISWTLHYWKKDNIIVTAGGESKSTDRSKMMLGFWDAFIQMCISLLYSGQQQFKWRCWLVYTSSVTYGAKDPCLLRRALLATEAAMP